MSNDIKRVLVTGALGQIGTELVLEMRRRYGNENVLATDIKDDVPPILAGTGPYEILDIRNLEQVDEKVKNFKADTIVHLAAILSAVGESNPMFCWQINMNGTINILNTALRYKCNRVFIPSSIAVWGPDCPKVARQDSTLKPTTMYGVTKVAGEVLCDYYFNKYGLDCRGVRYPGIISSEAAPGGGTTDYAVEIYYEAIKNNHYKCFLREDSKLPMMYMPDCLKATLDLMEAPIENLKHHSDFNLASMSFTAGELAACIKKYKPGFEVVYEPDFHQPIADSWPDEVDDTPAREEWGWSPSYNIDTMTIDMLEKLSDKHSKGLLP